jgi:hypothetical protein
MSKNLISGRWSGIRETRQKGGEDKRDQKEGGNKRDQKEGGYKETRKKGVGERRPERRGEG